MWLCNKLSELFCCNKQKDFLDIEEMILISTLGIKNGIFIIVNPENNTSVASISYRYSNDDGFFVVEHYTGDKCYEKLLKSIVEGYIYPSELNGHINYSKNTTKVKTLIKIGRDYIQKNPRLNIILMIEKL